MNLQLVYPYFKSLSKNENTFYQKKNQKFPTASVGPRIYGVEGLSVMYYATITDVENFS